MVSDHHHYKKLQHTIQNSHLNTHHNTHIHKWSSERGFHTPWQDATLSQNEYLKKKKEKNIMPNYNMTITFLVINP